MDWNTCDGRRGKGGVCELDRKELSHEEKVQRKQRTARETQPQTGPWKELSRSRTLLHEL